ncbi:MAG TPA: rhomboid family intramembrane serine protease [Allosphingosinicella sp.]|jgi:membrane associated rhomboid family serine protease
MRPPENWSAARVTLAIAAVTAAAWAAAALFRLQTYAVVVGGFIPGRLAGLPNDDIPSPVFLTPLTATLVHGGLVHLLFNLLILLFCGRAVENIVGGKGLILLYVLGAYAAAAGHWTVQPDSLVPMVGASGAISAVIGAYALLFGRNRTKIADPRLAMIVHALWLAVAWVALQLLIGFAFNTMGEGMESVAGIAIAAHIGGFLVGLLLAKPLLLWRWRGA